jgi:hypothetical protein
MAGDTMIRIKLAELVVLLQRSSAKCIHNFGSRNWVAPHSEIRFRFWELDIDFPNKQALEFVTARI